MKWNLMLIIVLYLLSKSTNCQVIFEQNSIKGGISAGGFSTGVGAGPGFVSLYKSPGSTIKKIGMFCYSTNSPLTDCPILINNILIPINKNDIVSTFNSGVLNYNNIDIYYKEITNYFDTTSFLIEIPAQPGAPFEAYFSTYIYIIYEDFNQLNTEFAIYLNNQDIIGYHEYLLYNFNTINRQQIGRASCRE